MRQIRQKLELLLLLQPLFLLLLLGLLCPIRAGKLKFFTLQVFRGFKICKVFKRFFIGLCSIKTMLTITRQKNIFKSSLSQHYILFK